MTKTVTLGQLATVRIPAGFTMEASDALPDAEKVTFRFAEPDGQLRITMFHSVGAPFRWQTYLRTVEPGDAELGSRSGGPELETGNNEWLWARWDPQSFGRRIQTVVAYSAEKGAAVYAEISSGEPAEAVLQMARTILDSIVVISGERMAWFAASSRHAWTPAERMLRNERLSRVALQAAGWPVPEDREAAGRTSRWDADELVVSDCVYGAPIQTVNWLAEQLRWGGFGHGLQTHERDGGSAELRLEARADMNEEAWDATETEEFRRRYQELVRRITGLLRTPASDIVMPETGEAEEHGNESREMAYTPRQVPANAFATTMELRLALHGTH